MSKPAGKCVFCGEPRLTHGHVWPDWLNNILPYTATHHEQATGFFFTFTPEIPGPAKVVRQRQGHARSRKPRNTCRKCNNTWMSEIENDAISATTRLIRGENFQLSEVDQAKLATFLCLISMRLEFLGELRAIPPSDRLYIKTNREPPPVWSVWITKFAGEKPDEHWARYCAMHVTSTPAVKSGPDYCNTQCTTMVIGKLCAHLYSSTETPILGYDGVRLTRIWPPSGFSIDTRFLPALDDKTVLWLHEAMARESTPVPKNLTHENPPKREGDHTLT